LTGKPEAYRDVLRQAAEDLRGGIGRTQVNNLR